MNTQSMTRPFRFLSVVLALLTLVACGGGGGGGGGGGSSTAADSAPGSLDAGFGTGGIVTTIFGTGAEAASAIALQADGKIVAAGYSWNGVGGVGSDFAIARYHSDGSLDAGFGSDGKVTTTITTSAAAARAVVIQPDGKIIAVGNNWNGSDQDPTLVRYLSSGLLDPTFGSGGIVATKSPNPGSYIETAALQADGKIVVGGYMSNGTYAVFLVGRYNNDGSPDMSFGGTSGFVGMDFGGSAYLNAIAVQPDGKIVVAGSAWNGGGNSIALVRYTNNGSTIDATFGSGGVVRTPIGSDDDVASSIAIAPDGKIVVGGTTWNQATGTFDLVLVRYQSNGLLDTEFGSGGKATLFTGSTNDHASFVALQADGAVVLAGTRSLTGAPTDLILCRYRGNGSLDTGFGTNGTVTTAIGTIGDEANAIAIQTDGKITVAGSTSNGTKTSFALLRYNP